MSDVTKLSVMQCFTFLNMQLKQHINGNNLENPRQSAYKNGHSTETALLHADHCG